MLFVRWIARRAGAGRPVEVGGIDCIRRRDGLVKETWTHYDPVLLDSLRDGHLDG